MKNSKWILSVFVVGLAVFLLGARTADKIGKVTVVNGGVYEVENKDKKVKVGNLSFWVMNTKQQREVYLKSHT